MKIIRIGSLFEFGRGKCLVEAVSRSRAWRKMYWFLVAFGVGCWGLLFWFSFYFPGSYGQ